MTMKTRRYKQHWLAKLNNRQVRQIRRLLDAGWPQLKIARKFRVSQPTVHNIHIQKTYRRVA